MDFLVVIILNSSIVGILIMSGKSIVAKYIVGPHH